MEVASKEDMAKFKDEILQAINAKITEKEIPAIIHTDKVQEILGGVSYGFVTELRRKKVLNPVQIGKIWFWNLEEVLSILPKSPQTTQLK